MSLHKRSLVHLLCLLMIAAGVTARPGKTRRGFMKNHKMVNGEPVPSRNFTFLASLRIMPQELHRCGGFLISPNHVMTTASCIYSTGTKELHAYLNPLRLDTLGTYIKVTDIHPHPNFTLTPHEHDIAVLKLERSYDGNVAVIPDSADLSPKSSVYTFGWGYNKISGEVGNFALHHLKLKIMSNGLCSLVLREYLGCEILCAASQTQFATTSADIGTPLIHMADGKMYAVGMLVRGTEEMVSAAPYLKLHPYLEWAKKIIDESVTTLLPTTNSVTTTPEETTTVDVTESPTPTPEETVPPAEENAPGDEFPDPMGTDQVRKRAAYLRQALRDGSKMGKRQINHYG